MTCQLTKQTHRYVHVDLVSRPTARKHDRSISFVQCTSEFRISLVHLSRACVASVKFQIIDSPVGKCLKKEKKEEKTKKTQRKNTNKYSKLLCSNLLILNVHDFEKYKGIIIFTLNTLHLRK